MSEEDRAELPVLATARLTQEQVEVLTVKALIAENEELSDAIDGKQVRVITQWQTSKWSDQDALVHIAFAQVDEADGEADDNSGSNTDSVSDAEAEKEDWEEPDDA